MKHFVRCNEVLRNAGVDYWVSCGSLLGIVREGALLDHDKDIDFATFEWPRHALVAEAFLEAGYTMETLGQPHYGYQQAFFWDSVHIADIFYFYPAGPDRCWQGSYGPDGLLWSEFDIDLFLPTQDHDFKGIPIRLPHHPKAVCEARYGDWRTPMTEWHYDYDPVCLTEAKW